MTDEKATFVEDLRYKKGLAYSGRHRVNGSKSRKCSLPSDSLTAAQRRKLNGEVMEYKIGQKISWEEFKSYPFEMQEKYLRYFADNHGASPLMMCKVFERSNPVLYAYLKEHGLTGILHRQPTKAAIEKFDAWLNQTEECEETPVATVEEKPVVVEKVIEAPKPEPAYFVHTIQEGSMNLSGTATEIFQTLFGIFRDANLNLEVRFSVLPKEEPELEIEEVDDGLLDLNSCNFKDLRAVGFSPNIAATVMQSRPFASVEDLRNVPGMTDIGYKILSQKVRV